MAYGVEIFLVDMICLGLFAVSSAKKAIFASFFIRDVTIQIANRPKSADFQRINPSKNQP
jgi:hypothetical protein